MTTELDTLLETKGLLRNILLFNEADVTFTKKDGTSRVMRCTLKEGVVVPHERKTERTREAKDNILPVWDLENNAWRSINIDTISHIGVVSQ